VIAPEFAMRRRPPKSQTILRLALCAALAVAAYVIDTSPAAAFGRGGFSRMGGGFGRPAFAGGPRRGAMASHRGFAGPPSAWRGRSAGLQQPGSRRPGGGGNGGRDPDPGGWRPRGGGNEPIVVPQGGGAGGGGVAGVIPGLGGGGGNGRGSGVPPRGERRFVPDEVLTIFSPNTTPEAIDRLARRYDLTARESQAFALIGSTIYRWHIGGGRSVANLVGALENERIITGAQPNYVFTLQEDAAAAASATAAPPGDAAQYVLNKLQVEEAHRFALGKSILVGAIDSEIDAGHPDLAGSVVKSFDALGGDEQPQQHGTAIAGAIAAHKKLLGIAPAAQLLAARAFDNTPGGAHGASFAIYKSIEWAVENGARIVNMSFSGPFDPALHQMLAAAHAKNLVLIAAAGNAGRNGPALYPAADPSVIAVTANDSHDDVFEMANRGPYIAVAAPGVDILALAPGDAYQITTGTSVAAAHVSGVAALLLERRPSLKPDDIRKILMRSAQALIDGGPWDFGAGLVNADRAVIAVDNKRPAPVDSAGEAEQ
jgi:subtilisin family serine protease